MCANVVNGINHQDPPRYNDTYVFILHPKKANGHPVEDSLETGREASGEGGNEEMCYKINDSCDSWFVLC